MGASLAGPPYHPPLLPSLHTYTRPPKVSHSSHARHYPLLVHHHHHHLLPTSPSTPAHRFLHHLLRFTKERRHDHLPPLRPFPLGHCHPLPLSPPTILHVPPPNASPFSPPPSADSRPLPNSLPTTARLLLITAFPHS
ncbi:hypothetical protein E2C01_053439 [Portunus trituberculatus]|uniref:Uncharacterized protein n=1 Tax=Portunus trituberculatus TaxID=210409 RepID=A0A5B7GGK3_PORTR|nr:hypothetical protein [Portunus trituberculatus]